MYILICVLGGIAFMHIGYGRNLVYTLTGFRSYFKGMLMASSFCGEGWLSVINESKTHRTRRLVLKLPLNRTGIPLYYS